MSQLDPSAIFALIAAQLPKDLHDHLLIIGSLAAAYHYKDKLFVDTVNTKDADVVVQPAGAIEECRTIAARLVAANWVRRAGCVPAATRDAVDKEQVIRLHPPGTDLYFVELLAFPADNQQEAREWIPIELEGGWYALPSFRHLRLLSLEQCTSAEGVRYASPAMMALANLLAHPTIGAKRVTEPIKNRNPLRSAKDLGRVLALARLADREGVEAWPAAWEKAVRAKYPATEAAALGASAGAGIRALLENREALEDARFCVDDGLLQGYNVTFEQMQAFGEQLIVDALDPFAERTR
jgi:hypothetical protein